MAVLTVNAGSSSLHLAYVADGSTEDRLDLAQPPTSAQAERAVDSFMADRPVPDAVGHRLVHGGDAIREPTIVDAEVRAQLDAAADMAPLHVPPALRLLDRLWERTPDVPHVVCPDTAFHFSLPEVAATYALPAEWRARWTLRRYGFHGLSYAWATGRAAKLLGRPVEELNLLLAHLSGGSSVCAVRDGRSVDTSMGFTPLDGVPMSTRSGAIDPGLLLWLLDRMDADELGDGLYHRSGLLGLSNGRSGDTRDLIAARGQDSAAGLALDVFIHRVRRELAAAATSLDRIDAIVFTGEIGWDQPEVREGVCAGLGVLGVPMPIVGNRDEDGPISPPDAEVPVLVIESREDLQISAEVHTTLNFGKRRWGQTE